MKTIELPSATPGDNLVAPHEFAALLEVVRRLEATHRERRLEPLSVLGPARRVAQRCLDMHPDRRSRFLQDLRTRETGPPDRASI